MAALSYYVSVLAIFACIYSIVTLGLNIQWGFAGILNFGVYAFVAIGAYTYALLTLGKPIPGASQTYILGLHLPFVVGLAAAGAVGGAVAWALGAVALRRLRSDYLAITTIAFSQILWLLAGNETWLANGWDGVSGIPQPFNGILKLSFNDYNFFFLGVSLVLLVLVVWLAQVMLRAPFGRILRGVREDEVVVESFGRNTASLKLRAFVIGAVLASIGGAMLAAYVGAFNPSAFLTGETFFVWAALLIGGSGNNWGAILGAVLVPVVFTEGTRFLPNIPSNPQLIEAFRYVIIGLLLILTLKFRPQGIVPERSDRFERDAKRGARLSSTPIPADEAGEPPHA
ncbi:MAG TPA: branched-chain amino acid ABC transporter permease [Trueperaceae bacterium]|nr:branched-chain amino acid ABC transporter permease [Trueperaceae bacterium]